MRNDVAASILYDGTQQTLTHMHEFNFALGWWWDDLK